MCVDVPQFIFQSIGLVFSLIFCLEGGGTAGFVFDRTHRSVRVVVSVVPFFPHVVGR